MTTPLFAPPAPILMPIAGRPETWPVNRVFCVGRNYAGHAREMGMEPDPNSFFYFTKWGSTIVPPGDLPFPPETQNFHYEGELVLAIGGHGHALSDADADALIWGYACGLDMTRRDLQTAMKDKGWPWDIAKNVEQAAPIGLIHPRSDVGTLDAGAISTWVDGAVKQQGDLADMMWSPARLVARISRAYHLQPGDLIFTGTPEGVGPVQPGQRIEVRIERLSPLAVRFVR
jgi:fumarylpyruvate hydrolase